MSEIRNYRKETVIHEDGLTATTHSVKEVRCPHCKEWIEARGVMGMLRLMAGCPKCGKPID